APTEGVTEVRVRRIPDKRVGQGEISVQAIDEALAQVHADRLVELPRAEATVAVRRRKLDLHVRRDLGNELPFLENDVGHPEQHVSETALPRGTLGRRELATASALSLGHSAAGDDDVLRRLIDVRQRQTQPQAIDGPHAEAEGHVRSEEHTSELQSP